MSLLGVFYRVMLLKQTEHRGRREQTVVSRGHRPGCVWWTWVGGDGTERAVGGYIDVKWDTINKTGITRKKTLLLCRVRSGDE